MLDAYTALAVVMSLLVAASGLAKLRRDPRVVKVITGVVRVPLKWFPWLAACEFAGAIGLLVGIVWPPLGLAASVGLVLYFLGAMIAHVRVGDLKGLGPAAFLFVLASACLVSRFVGV
jgi:DoxX-like family